MKHFHLFFSFALATVLLFSSADAFAKTKAGKKDKDDPKSSGKILLFCDIETVDSRADNRYQPKPMPMMGESALPHSESELASLDPERMAIAIAENDAVRKRNFDAKQAILWARYQEQVAHQKAMIQKYKGTQAGRHMFVARDWFASAIMEEGSDFFEVIHHMDTDKAEFEKQIKDDVGEVSAGEYMAILVLADPIQKTSEMDFPGATTIARTICTMRITAEVQTLDGRVVYSKTVEGKATARESNAARSSGSDDLVGKTIEDGLKKAAEAIVDHFTCEITIEVKGPKDDEDFDEDEVELTLDGNPVSAGEEVRVTKGVHTLEAECEGYEQKGSTKITVNKSGEKKVVMKKSTAKDGNGDGDED